MKHIKQYALITTTLMLMLACGQSKKENDAALAAKKEQLAKLQQQQEKLNAQITELQDEIETLDPESANKIFKLVAIDTLLKDDFNHYIELQGKVDAENISIVTPRGNPGQVKEVYVKKGDIVKKGQLLLKLDDAIYRQNLVASNESIKTLRTQLSLAADLLQRQQNLWDQGIGTEVQLLTAKNNVETLKTQ
ncbi:MAG TPA: biotin/lipoyl-binding protein, partial [Phnomibacter sp.]|nr:biotin/lipoyl-binding protein [Phnomibacter sp.]